MDLVTNLDYSDIIPKIVFFGGIALVLVLMAKAYGIVAGFIRKIMAPDKDPKRVYSRSEKDEGKRRCGGRCEHKSMFWFRCRQTQKLQGDHIYPHTLGGQTIMSNLQMLCPSHNREKWMDRPSWLYLRRLERRRRRYFPAGVDVSVSWKPQR